MLVYTSESFSNPVDYMVNEVFTVALLFSARRNPGLSRLERPLPLPPSSRQYGITAFAAVPSRPFRIEIHISDAIV